MKFKQHKEFPRFAALISNLFPILEFAGPKIHEAFLKFCIDHDYANQALTPHKNPLIVVAEIKDIDGNLQRNIRGVYFGGPGEELKQVIFIQQENVEFFEKGEDNGLDLERIILHEMVHWARQVSGNPERTPDDKEAGSQFEREGYGTPPVTDHRSVSYLARPPIP